MAVFGILAIGGIALALVTPNLSKARISAEEMAAIHSVRAICAAEVQYYTLYDRYAASLSELGPPSDGKAGPSSADLLPADLAAGVKGGYTYTLKVSPAGFMVNANPVKYGTTGRRTFFSDESLVIRANSSPQPATAASAELK
ncbi:MAG TPA: pilin, type IV [Bryobacteraceae bacterium]